MLSFTASKKKGNLGTSMKLYKKAKKQAKKYYKKFKLEEFAIEVLVVFTTILMAYFTFQVFQLYTYPQCNFNILPSRYTLFAYDWNPRLNNPFEKDLQSQLGLAYSVQISNIEQQVLPPEIIQSLKMFGFSSKTIAYLWIDDAVEPVILLKYDKIQNSKAEEYLAGYQRNDWYLIKKKNVLIFSKSKSALKAITTGSKKVSDDTLYLDAASNVQNQSYGKFYLSHKLLNEYLKIKQTQVGILTYTPVILDRFGATVGTIIPSSDGVYVNTYTNPIAQNRQPFPHSRVNFRAKLLQQSVIPANPSLLISGSDLTQRFYKFLEGSNEAQENSAWISKSLNNILTTYNLDQEVVSVVNEIFNNEFLIATYQEGKFVIAFDKLKNKDQKKLIGQLDKLMQFFNPRTISYILPDGQIGRQLIPNEDINHIEINDQYEFTFDEINTDLFIKNVDGYTLISNFEFDNQTPDNAGIPLDKINKVLPIADEILELSPEFIYPYVKNQLDAHEVPHITTATNFFSDGIQTVSLLTWPTK